MPESLVIVKRAEFESGAEWAPYAGVQHLDGFGLSNYSISGSACDRNLEAVLENETLSADRVRFPTCRLHVRLSESD
jgi:hypothetical protein